MSKESEGDKSEENKSEVKGEKSAETKSEVKGEKSVEKKADEKGEQSAENKSEVKESKDTESNEIKPSPSKKPQEEVTVGKDAFGRATCGIKEGPSCHESQIPFLEKKGECCSKGSSDKGDAKTSSMDTDGKASVEKSSSPSKDTDGKASVTKSSSPSKDPDGKPPVTKPSSTSKDTDGKPPVTKSSSPSEGTDGKANMTKSSSPITDASSEMASMTPSGWWPKFPRQWQLIGRWWPSAALYLTTTAILTVWVTEWKSILKHVPIIGKREDIPDGPTEPTIDDAGPPIDGDADAVVDDGGGAANGANHENNGGPRTAPT